MDGRLLYKHSPKTEKCKCNVCYNVSYTISPSSVNGQIHFKFTFLKVLEIDRECNIFPLEKSLVHLYIYIYINIYL